LGQVVQRHEALRTTFRVTGGEPVQVIASDAGVSLPVIDLSVLPGPLRGAKVRELAALEAATPFDLARGPLLRLTLLRLEEAEHVLLLTIHHIAADGESVALLIDEAAALYLALSRGEPSPFEALPVQYADYAHWQRRWLQGDVLAERLSYWRRQLAGEWSSRLLPVDHLPLARRSHHGTDHPFRLSSSQVEAIRAICMRETATPFMFLLASLAFLLSHLAARREVTIGADLSSRTRPETEGLIGHFVNVLPVRADLSGNPRFLELLRRVRKASLDAIQQELPYERLVEELKPERAIDGSSLLQVVLNFISSRRKNVDRLLDAAGLKLSLIELEDRLVRFDLMLVMNEADGVLSGAWIYSTELFEPATIASLHDRFMTLLGRVIENPEATLSELTAQEAAERDCEQEWARHELNRRRLRAVEPKPVRL
jgi:hypothetical protein